MRVWGKRLSSCNFFCKNIENESWKELTYTDSSFYKWGTWKRPEKPSKESQVTKPGVLPRTQEYSSVVAGGGWKVLWEMGTRLGSTPDPPASQEYDLENPFISKLGLL